MKVAVFYPDTRYAAWSAAQGLGPTLRRMGCTVLEAPIPVEASNLNEAQLEMLKGTLPTIEALKACDLILLSGPEHFIPWLDAVYGKTEWMGLGVPRCSWYHESFFREDYQIAFDEVSGWADEHFFPAYQDADFFDQESFAKGRTHWLPFGVDTQVFKPYGAFHGANNYFDTSCKKLWDVAFIGSMYEKRKNYLNALARHRIPRIRIGSVVVQDLGGWQARESAVRLAENYRQTGVFFNLVAMSKLLVSKLYEVIACGTFLLTPELPPDQGADKNMAPFQSGKHLIYYRASNLPFVAQLLRDYSADPEKRAERERIAAAGCAEVYEKHSLEKRLTQVLAVCGVKEAVQ